MRILVVNWQDVDNPQAGGAEIHLFEIFRRIADRGHRIDLATSGWEGAPETDAILGIDVHRAGGRNSFALAGPRLVRTLLSEHDYDVIVEDINKIPLFVPLYSTVPVYVIVPHLFGSTAFREASVPVAATVWLAERPVPFVYRESFFQAISDSTKDDLVNRGVEPSRIKVIYPGVDSNAMTPVPGWRTRTPTFTYIGRLKRYKSVDVAIRAVASLRESSPDVKLRIAGSGDDEARLRQLTESLGVNDAVEFLGFVDEDTKLELLRSSWANVFPSPKEGWGITNIEAAACGTPSIAADSPGLRESVRDGETGLLTPYGDAAALARAMRRLAGDRQLVDELGGHARHFAENLSWDRTADETEAHIVKFLDWRTRTQS